MVDAADYPVRVEGRLDAVSRWLWLFKWILVIPHLIVLFFLWIAFAILTVIVFFAILITARYPEPIFRFNVGVMRWSWRVHFYTYSALGTDRYPPFTLATVDDYPAQFDVAYPERLSRGLVLVKWWLLAIPHFIVLGFFTGAGSYAVRKDEFYDTWTGNSGEYIFVPVLPGLLYVLVFFVAIVLLFTGGYPRGIFDFVMGMNRWSWRVGAYVSLMTDHYPPFRIDLGGRDPNQPAPPPAPPSSSGDDMPVAGGGIA
ncbi:DUF4389 domain-containing protein [Nocardiopsis gilva YIM 90087]|uniref:DUF4389 domain-containing protein n=1 Tax=Nocardiopsis gilva YIM 90087 TaxID=1235441 RepID=A0A223S892_9ACTN|nr:DUF4389 domain-containing protein [Nocardiopsis gilva]ASU84344.1 DUF4389 domain-containing protein [Nocardiopsis gilva YIM 90087]